ncbi:MAG: hypothetical protein H0T60_10700 [Acidobacteria bacterium]|nr:hypothetical protein [Acidobacteriota bacterium]
MRKMLKLGGRIFLVLVVILSVLLTVKLIRRTFFPRSTASATAARGPTLLGAKVSVPGFDWSQGEYTIVLALHKECEFCRLSAPFYQRLVREMSGRADTRIIAALPHQVDEGRKYLDELGVQVSGVHQVDFKSMGIAYTPTILLVDRQGTVTGLWAGKIPEKKEDRALSLLRRDIP